MLCFTHASVFMSLLLSQFVSPYFDQYNPPFFHQLHVSFNRGEVERDKLGVWD